MDRLSSAYRASSSVFGTSFDDKMDADVDDNNMDDNRMYSDDSHEKSDANFKEPKDGLVVKFLPVVFFILES